MLSQAAAPSPRPMFLVARWAIASAFVACAGALVVQLSKHLPGRQSGSATPSEIAARSTVARSLPESSPAPTSGAGGVRKEPLPPSEVRQRFEMAFANSPADPQWSARAKRIAAEKLRSLLPEGSAVRSFECRTSMCRLETSHAGRQGYLKFAQAAFMGPSTGLWNAPAFSTPLRDPSARDGLMVSFIAREGGTLPDLDE